MKTTDDLKLNDTVWKNCGIENPSKWKITSLNSRYVEVDGYSCVAEDEGRTILKDTRFSDRFFLNERDALLNQYECLRKAAKEAQKKVVVALAEVDSILEQKDKLVFEINEQASIKLDWLDAKKMAQDTDELINPL